MNSIQRNFLVLSLSYVLMLVWIWAGVYMTSGRAFLYLIPILLLPFTATWIIIYLAFSRPFAVCLLLRVGSFRNGSPASKVLFSLCLVAAIFIPLHWYFLGHIPILSAFQTIDRIEAGMIRQEIVDAPIGIVYLSSLIVKALIPVVVIALLKNKKDAIWTWMFILLSWIYALSLMQKSFPIVVLGPAGLWCLLSKRLISAVALFGLIFAGVVLGTLAANPEIRPHFLALFASNAPFASKMSQPRKSLPERKIEEAPSVGVVAGDVYSGLSQRVLVLPGEVVSKWLSAIPRYLPFENGCGYRFVAPLLHCQFIDNAPLLYKLYYPNLYDRGYKGSMNAAHFAEEYANFGPYGLILSGILACAAIALASAAFMCAGLAATVALNMIFVLVLGSTALHTTLASGGWICVMILAFVLFRPDNSISSAFELNHQSVDVDDLGR